tara:strand:+ start:1841 stop:3103 length:1263 start_codon:yes stop_codon:yes gene_type:complete
MDINESLQPVVAGIIQNLKGDLESELREQISQEVVKAIAGTEVQAIAERIISGRLNERIAEFNIETKTKDKLDQALAKIISNLTANLTKTANEQVKTEIDARVATMDLQSVLGAMVESKIGNLVQTGAFGKESINHTAIDFKGFNFTGDQVKGGIIQEFGSTGIEDRSTKIQMTVMDTAVAFEQAMWAPKATIKGDLIVDGTLKLTGDIDPSGPAVNTLAELTVEKIAEDSTLLGLHSETILKDIGNRGLDLDRITQQGREIVAGNQLGYHITDSNLQRVGTLRDLQTTGESVLSDTLYTTGKRVGINTIEPSATLSIWDEEIEISIGKKSKDSGFIGMDRSQSLVIGSAGNSNLIVQPDGSVEIENLRVGNTPMSSEAVCPDYSAITGTIVWNESPGMGGPAGWINLGGSAWGKFGIIE